MTWEMLSNASSFVSQWEEGRLSVSCTSLLRRPVNQMSGSPLPSERLN